MMSRDPLPLLCLFTGDSGASVQPWWTWQVVPLAVPLSVPLAVPAWLSCWGAAEPWCLRFKTSSSREVPRYSLGDPAPMRGCKWWQWRAPTVTAPSAMEEHRGFCPEPPWGQDEVLSCSLPREAVLHPGAIWDGHRRQPAGMELLHRAVCTGTGVVGGWHLVALILAWSSLVLGIMSGSSAASCETCWTEWGSAPPPRALHSALSSGISSPQWLLWCARAQPWTWCQEVTVVLVPVPEMFSSCKGCRWQGAGCAALCVPWPILWLPRSDPMEGT